MTKSSDLIQPEYLLLGRILRPHGVRGELKIQVATDYPERIAELETVYIASDMNAENPRPYAVQAARLHQGYVLLTIKGIASRNDADKLRGSYVMVNVADAVPLDEDEFYLYELIGMQVVTEDGQELGAIAEVMETGANDVYIVRSDTGTILLPAHEETVIEYDFDARTVTMRLPDGLLPD